MARPIGQLSLEEVQRLIGDLLLGNESNRLRMQEMDELLKEQDRPSDVVPLETKEV